MAGSFSDAAVSNHGPVRCDAYATVQRHDLIVALECAVVVARPGPGDVLGSRYVPPTLARFGQASGCQHDPCELVGAAHVDQCHSIVLHRVAHIRQERSQRKVRLACSIALRTGTLWVLGDLRGKLATLLDPFLAATVHEPNVTVAVHLQLPEGPGREPVVVVTVQ